eukprot:3356096-Prymnesium_polylepis.1
MQLVLILAKAQQGTGGVSWVPMLLRVQRLVRFWKTHARSTGDDMLIAYINHEFAKQPAWRDVLLQAYQMRLLVALIDGVDEAAGLKTEIEDFIVNKLAPGGTKVVVTSRPEGVRLWLYQEEWVVMSLAKLSDEQARAAVNSQLGSN